MAETNSKHQHRIILEDGVTEAAAVAKAAVHSAANAAYVIHAFQGNVLGDGIDFSSLIEALDSSIEKTSKGDLANLESMLVGQALALQSIFTSLARGAAGQKNMKHYESLLGLALKAQANSRATIQAVVDLKYPRQAVFAKQANISNGPQQVNNHAASHSPRADEVEKSPNKQLEQASHESFRVDAGTAEETVPVDQNVATMGPINRATH